MISKLIGLRLFDIEASSCCTLACQFCPRQFLPSKGLMKRTTFQRFTEIVELKRSDTVSFIGIGEPLLNPDLSFFVREVSRRYPQARTWVTTNAQLLNERRGKELLDAGLGTLDVSFNGISEKEYETKMAGAQFNRTLSQIESFANEIERTRASTRLQINFIISEQSLEEIENIKNFWKNHGVNRFRLQYLHNRAGLLDGASANPMKCLKSCDLFEAFTWISWKGEVHTCCHDFKREHPLVNIADSNWEQIIKIKKKMMHNRQWPDYCYRCKDPQQTQLWKTLDRDVWLELGVELGLLFKSLRKK